MKEVYCSYEIAKLLKEKGFDEECTHYYSCEDDELIEYTNGVYSRNSKDCHRCTSPTHQMACAWCRDEGYHIYTFKGVDSWVYEVQSLNEDWTYHLGCLKDHDDAIEAALKYTLENLI